MDKREVPILDGFPFQFRLRSLFFLMTVAATVSALAHYLGEVVLRWLAIGIFLMIVLAFVALGPGLVTEVVTLIVDRSLVAIGVIRRSLHKHLTAAAKAAGQHDSAASPGRR